MFTRRLNSLAAVMAACVLFMPAVSMAQDPEPAPVQVMVLGTYHFDNPGQDVHNARVDPVTTPEKQAQLAALAERLAAFRPTAIALERVAADPATLMDQHFADFEPADLLTDADERVQIGYRLAALAQVDRVLAIDEQSDTRDYFPFGPVMAWVEANGRREAFARLNAPVAAAMAELERRQSEDTIGDILADMNRRDHPVFGDPAQSFYYRMLAFGDGAEQPGAALNAGWYERNARIFAKLMHATRPGDRVVVVFGGGHGYWLRHFVEVTPGFDLVDPAPYLREP
ncbi:MAG: DUF5694 domain-containing protein [Brevundimonas sp.]